MSSASTSKSYWPRLSKCFVHEPMAHLRNTQWYWRWITEEAGANCRRNITDKSAVNVPYQETRLANAYNAHDGQWLIKSFACSSHCTRSIACCINIQYKPKSQHDPDSFHLFPIANLQQHFSPFDWRTLCRTIIAWEREINSMKLWYHQD